uniref:LIM zinc finger domain containing 2 n=1 Tax=Eptatretus burgeri TaxID=7764 RepID=A0A8C4QZI6_EPTBU
MDGEFVEIVAVSELAVGDGAGNTRTDGHENGMGPGKEDGDERFEGDHAVSQPQRRQSDARIFSSFHDSDHMAEALSRAACERCQAGFTSTQRIVSSEGQLYHEGCFVCAQCFQPFPDGLFYEFEDRKYCEHDFHILFAPCCGHCGEFIVGRVIKAMNNSWHPDCFRCDICSVALADVGFVKNADRHLCRPCHTAERATGLGHSLCHKCHLIIEEEPLMFRSDPYHADHFNCQNCRYLNKSSI